jgi:hypothetical protein
MVRVRKTVPALAAMALALLLSLGVAGSILGDAGALTSKPNIVFILTDDMRKDDPRHAPSCRIRG